MEYLTIHAFDWEIEEELNITNNTEINCWALTEKSEPCLLRILNFSVSRIWMLPNKSWSTRDINVIIAKIKDKGENAIRQFKVTGGSLLIKKKLYYLLPGLGFFLPT